jgi:hypothetical protein
MWRNDDIELYNQASANVTRQAGQVAVCDLYGFVEAHCGVGYEVCGCSRAVI